MCVVERRTQNTGRLTFSPSERSTKSCVLADDVVIYVLDQLGSVFAFLAVALARFRPPRGVLLGERVKLAVAIRLVGEHGHRHFKNIELITRIFTTKRNTHAPFSSGTQRASQQEQAPKHCCHKNQG